MRADLHCHSKHSKKPSIWLMKKIGCPESFTEPLELYRIARAKGMDAVTITDHNEIAACLEISHLPNTFISNEVTAHFPEDRCKVHVLVYGITESQFREIEKLRFNLYEFVDYLKREGILHSLAHPFYQVNDFLGVEHLEKLLLLFKHVELNGDQNPDANAFLETLVRGLRREDIEAMADRHRIIPTFEEPWVKHWTGGSDDHSSLHLARTFTEIEGARTLQQYFEGIRQGKARVEGPPATPLMMAHNVYGIAYQYYKSRFGLERHVTKDVLLRFLDRSLHRPEQPEGSLFSKAVAMISQRRGAAAVEPSANPGIFDLLRHESRKLIAEDADLAKFMKGDGEPAQIESEERWFRFVNQVSNKALMSFGERILDNLLNLHIFDAFPALGSAGALYSMLSPYFVAYSLNAKEKRFARMATQALLAGRADWAQSEEPKVAHFTDTLFDVNGVAQTLRQEAAIARRAGKRYDLLTSTDKLPAESDPSILNFAPVGKYEIPEYEELKLAFPPFLEMLDRCYREGYTHLHVATPGPCGLAALAISRILKLPISGTYHTSFPQFAHHLTDDEGIEEAMWKYMLWFYDQMDTIFVPSEATGAELAAKGFPRSKLCVYPRGIDVERFHPAKRCAILEEKFGAAGGVNMLYVGRVSKEKNLDVLANAYAAISEENPDARLIVVGDGPYLAEMRERLRGTPAIFTGYLAGEELAQVYASCDLFVFPSATDTFGNVVLEAQASGIPIIVTDLGGPQENLIPGRTGLIVRAGDEASLRGAMRSLAADPARLRAMGAAAREYLDSRSLEAAFLQTYKMFVAEPGSLPPLTPTRRADAA